MSQGPCPSCGAAVNLTAVRSFILCLLVAMVAGCEKPASKLSMLDGATYVGDAAPRKVMGVSMIGRYKLKFFKGTDGQLKCTLTVTIQDGLHGWGQPDVSEIKGLTFETGGGINHDEVMIIRDDHCQAYAPGSIVTGQVPDSLTLFDENSYEIKLMKVAADGSEGHSQQTRVRAAPVVLMPRENFEGLFGAPLLTSDDLSKEFNRRYGFSLEEFLGHMSPSEFQVLEEQKEQTLKTLHTQTKGNGDLNDTSCSITNFNWILIQKLLENLSWHSDGSMGDYYGSLVLPGIIGRKSSPRYFYDMVYYPWFLERKLGLSGISFADYQIKDSSQHVVRAFYRDNRLLLMREYSIKRVDKTSVGLNESERFVQIEGGNPLLTKTNNGKIYASPSPEDPLNLCNLELMPSVNNDETFANVTMVGTNYFGQLVKSTIIEEDECGLIIGDASVLYPLALEDTQKSRRDEQRFQERYHAEVNALYQKLEREAARDALMEELRRRAKPVALLLVDVAYAAGETVKMVADD